MSNAADKFKEWTAKKYQEQAVGFLNAYWPNVQGDVEKMWEWCNQFIALDNEKGKEGNDLDEFNAHRFLEKLGETRTIKEMRDELREIDMDFNKRMALIEYLLFRYRYTISDFVRRPQGGNSEEISRAQRNLEVAQAALEEAKTAADKATRQHELSVQAEQELKAALNELHAQEDAYNRKKAELEKKVRGS